MPRHVRSRRPATLTISAAAERLGISPRMLRYREALGLLPVTQAGTRDRPNGRGHAHRRFGDDDVRAVELGLEIEKDYDITPAALAFALRVLADPRARERVRELGVRIGRLNPPPTRALDWEQEKALRLLGGRRPRPPGAGGASPGAGRAR
ncbi:MAG: MerR family DNA-binding transcriptional regulator [Streptosporangiales bacterium]|nr:MerR family DNA-binding transcriptional regulator [Streptosporangiales bacterium]